MMLEFHDSLLSFVFMLVVIIIITVCKKVVCKFYASTASSSLKDHENNSGSTSYRKLRVTLLSSEWSSTKGGLSTINRELAIQLAKRPSVEVSVYGTPTLSHVFR